MRGKYTAPKLFHNTETPQRSESHMWTMLCRSPLWRGPSGWWPRCIHKRSGCILVGGQWRPLLLWKWPAHWGMCLSRRASAGHQGHRRNGGCWGQHKRTAGSGGGCDTGHWHRRESRTQLLVRCTAPVPWQCCSGEGGRWPRTDHRPSRWAGNHPDQ